MRWLSCHILIAVLMSWTCFAQQVVDRIVAQVNNDIITLSDLSREMGDVRRDLSSRFTGAQLDLEMKKAEDQMLEELIRQKLLLQKAAELGFGSNVDIQVSAYIERIRKENNIKDMQEFEQALAQQGQTLAGYREYVRRQYIIQGLVQEFVGSRITLLSEEVDRYYRDHKSDFSTPEEVTLSEILIPESGGDSDAAARAAEIHKRLTQGESFTELASQYSKGPTASKGGSIGTYVLSKLSPEITRAIAGLKENEITPVQKMGSGYVILHVDGRKPVITRPLEEVREEIKNRLYQQKFQPEYDRFLAQLREEAYIQIFSEIKP
jgi:peptidyl-prolyl cis-trans isomerase SurA